MSFEEYEGDVWYEIWKQGGNPDLADPDRIQDYYDDDLYPEDAARRERMLHYG